jgi:CheY-like chemotaxis protein
MRRIPVVDDDLHVGQAISVWLRAQGLRVAAADGVATGFAALDAIRLFHERAPTVPLIAISGYAFSGTECTGSEFVRLATRLGATRCLRKPFKPMTLLGVIDECLSAAEPHRRQVATLGVVADSLSERQTKPNVLGSCDRRASRTEALRWEVVVTRGNLETRAVGGRRRNAAKLE